LKTLSDSTLLSLDILENADSLISKPFYADVPFDLASFKLASEIVPADLRFFTLS
jgi:hypothetical protein